MARNGAKLDQSGIFEISWPVQYKYTCMLRLLTKRGYAVLSNYTIGINGPDTWLPLMCDLATVYMMIRGFRVGPKLGQICIKFDKFLT